MHGKNEEMLEKGSFRELIFKLSLPAMVIILIMIIYNMADTFFIGQLGNPDKISAISICMPVFSVMSGLGTLFGVGGSTAISISLGEKNYEKVGQITSFCTLGCVAIGTFGTIIIFLLSPELCALLGANEDVILDAIKYLRVFSLCCPFVIFSNAMGSILRSDGEAALAMIANILGTVSNIILDAIFILVFGWDVTGAAIATVIGNFIATVAVLFIIYKKKTNFIPRIKNFTLNKDISIPVLTLGLPMTFSTVLSSLSGAIQNRLMIGHGSNYLAAQSVAGKMGMLITMLIMGICMGLQPAISYNFGSRNFKRMNEIMRKLFTFSISLGLILALFVFLLRSQVVAAFIDNEQVISLGGIFVIASVCMAPFYAIYQVCQVFFQSTGKVNYAITSSLLDKGLVFIPVLYVMNYSYGAYGIAFSHLVTMIISVGVVLVMYGVWSKKMKQ